MVSVAFKSAAAARRNQSCNPIDRHVGARVRMRRLMLDQSQTDLAETLGLTFQQIQKYEKGTNRISASKLFQIAREFDVPIAFFFDGMPGPRPPRDGTAATTLLDNFLASADGIAIAQSFSRIESDKLRRRVVQLVGEIAGETAAP